MAPTSQPTIAEQINPENTATRQPTEELVAVVEATEIPLKTALIASNPAVFKRASGSLQLVEFFAFWCPICQSLAPVVHGLEVKFHPDIRFVYRDIDDRNTQDIRNDLGYVYQPHLFLLDPDGNIIEQWVGYVPDQVLEDSFGRALGDG